jgi:hypothetical protein
VAETAVVEITVFWHYFTASVGNRPIGADTVTVSKPVKVLHITPEPKPISVGIIGAKGRLSPAAEKFWQCAKEAVSPK